MKNSALFGLAVTAAILTVGATDVAAQATRTWVSGVGDDANPCSRTAPCKTFAGAISKTAPGGEIDALDPGGFGALTITKSITIDGGPGVAGVLVAGTNGIVVAAGAGDAVTLRNLDFDGLVNSGNSGIKGIEFLSGARLVIENCVVYGFNLRGISIESTTAGAQTLISNTTVHNINNSSSVTVGNGVWVGGTNSVVINNVRSVNNANAGLAVNPGAAVQVRNSVFSNNGGLGIFSNNAIIDAQLVTVANNGTGVEATNTATIRMSAVSVINNAVGLSSSNNSVINSFGDNLIVGNQSGNGGVTLISKQ